MRGGFMLRSMVARQFAFGYPGFGMGSSRRPRRSAGPALSRKERERRRKIEEENTARREWWERQGVGSGWFK